MGTSDGPKMLVLTLPTSQAKPFLWTGPFWLAGPLSMHLVLDRPEQTVVCIMRVSTTAAAYVMCKPGPGRCGSANAVHSEPDLAVRVLASPSLPVPLLCLQ